MSPMFPFLTGMVPPLIKDKLMDRAEPQPIIEEETREYVATPAVNDMRMGGIGNLQQRFMQGGPLNRLGQFINQELAQENRGEVDEFIGEVGDMANQRFGVDLGSVGQRPMFRPELIRAVGTPIQGYKDGGAAFPDLSGDGKITQKDILIGRGVIEKEYGGPVGMQMGGDPMMAAGMPPPQAPPMPMPAPEQPPTPMQDQLDPNVVQNALAQAAGGIGDLDQAQNYEQIMNTMRGDQATVEERREELAGVVGPGDANQTPESVLTLVQPVMMLANVDQGIGQLAQQEMTQPMEGPMAGGIMSTVPEPPMMEAGGTAPVNFNKGGEVRPVQYFQNAGLVSGGKDPFANLAGTKLSPFVQQAFKARQPLLSDPADLEKQRDLTKAQILFDLAQTGLAFAAPMEGERPGLSAAERLALAAQKTQLPAKIGARAQALGDKEAAQKAADRAIMASAITSGEQRLAAAEQQEAAAALQKIKGEQKLAELNLQNAQEVSQINLKSKLDIIKQRLKTSQETAGKLSVEEAKAVNQKALEVVKFENEQALATLKANKDFESKTALQIQANDLEKQNMKLDNLLKRGRIRLDAEMTAKKLGLEHTNDLELQEKGHQHAVNMAIRGQAYARELKRIDIEMEQKRLDLAASTDAEKIQIQRELAELEQEKFDYEKLQAGLLDYSIGEKRSFNKFFTQVGDRKGLKLAKLYADGKTKPEENNTIHFVIENFTKDTLSEIDGAVVPGGILPEEWQEAVQKRLALSQNDNTITLPRAYLGLTSSVQPGSMIPTPILDNAINQVQTNNDIDDVTYNKLINEIDTLKGVGTPAALGQLVNKTSELLSFIISKPFPNIAKAVNLLEGFNLNAELVIMSSVKGKTDQDMRKRIEARLPQPAQFFAGKEDALDKIKLTEAFFNQEINSIQVQLSRPLKLTTKTELQADLAKFTAVRDGYTALRKSFERRFKQIETGGRPQDVDINEFINVDPER